LTPFGIKINGGLRVSEYILISRGGGVLEEKELIKDLKDGKEEAYYKLVNIYGNKLLRTCFLMLKDEKEAEDIVQDTFIKVFKYINGFKGNSSLYTWVYKIAQNIIKDKCKNDISTIPYEDKIT